MAAQELELRRAVASKHRELEQHLKLQQECEQLQRQVMLTTSAERIARRHVEEEQERVAHLQRICDELRAQHVMRPAAAAASNFRQRLAPVVAADIAQFEEPLAIED